MNEVNRRQAIKLGMLLALPIGAGHADGLLSYSQSAAESEKTYDWSAGVIATTMHRKPAPKDLGGWGYAVSLYLYGQYLYYLRTKDRRHLEYVQGWVDSHVSDDGVLDRKNLDALDYMLPGNLLLVLHKETGQQKYKTAADAIRKRFDTYPRTADGGFWHATSRQHQ